VHKEPRVGGIRRKSIRPRHSLLVGVKILARSKKRAAPKKNQKKQQKKKKKKNLERTRIPGKKKKKRVNGREY